MKERISPDSNDWKWGDLVTTKFKNQVWSSVKELRPYFDRYITIPGNANTNYIAEFNICNKFKEGEPVKFVAGKVAAYTHICEFAPEFNSEKNTYGVPGGMNEFPLMGNYDDMIEQHLIGDMWQMR